MDRFIHVYMLYSRCTHYALSECHTSHHNACVCTTQAACTMDPQWRTECMEQLSAARWIYAAARALPISLVGLVGLLTKCRAKTAQYSILNVLCIFKTLSPSFPLFPMICCNAKCVRCISFFQFLVKRQVAEIILYS